MIFQLVLLFSGFHCILARELLFVMEVSRHGARSPLHYMPWDEGKWPQGPGELTPAGMRQHYIIGWALRQRYIINEPFINRNYSESDVYIRSTNHNRTLESAMSQMLGLYPPPEGPSLRNKELEQKAVPPMSLHNQTRIIQELGLKALKGKTSLVPIHTRLIKSDTTLLPEDACLRYQQSMAMHKSLRDPQIRAYFEKYMATLQFIQKTFGVFIEDSLGIAFQVQDSIICNYFQDGNYSFLPANFTSGIRSDLAEIYTLGSLIVKFPDETINRLAGSQLLTDVLYYFNEALTKPKKKFVFYSGHDTTILNILFALGLNSTSDPPFASTLVFELYKDDRAAIYAQLLYNDVPQTIGDCANPVCEYSTFAKYLKSIIITNFSEVCNSYSPSTITKGSPLSESFSEPLAPAGGNDYTLKWSFWVFLACILLFTTGCMLMILRRLPKPGDPHASSLVDFS